MKYFLDSAKGRKQQFTRHARYSYFSSFFKFEERIFPITYAAARAMVKKAGLLAGVDLRPHDLLRHTATFASRSGVPIELVSKIILRHANLSTTRRFLGKVSDVEAMRYIENLFR
jgi:integrase/recombinase XerD